MVSFVPKKKNKYFFLVVSHWIAQRFEWCNVLPVACCLLPAAYEKPNIFPFSQFRHFILFANITHIVFVIFFFRNYEPDEWAPYSATKSMLSSSHVIICVDFSFKLWTRGKVFYFDNVFAFGHLWHIILLLQKKWTVLYLNWMWKRWMKKILHFVWYRIKIISMTTN